MNAFIEKPNNSATENPSAAFSARFDKIKFERSFTAKLILSEPFVKKLYADIVSEILKYDKIKSRTLWAGVTFTCGREKFASVAFSGKTLCLYLALAPDDASGGKYKTKDVSSVKKRVKTPSMLKIRSEGAKRFALKLIAEAAGNFGLSVKTDVAPPVNPAGFKTDTFNNLITRGLIRLVGRGSAAFAAEPQEKVFQQTSPDAYEDTIKALEGLLSRHGVYDDISVALAEGRCKVALSEKLMLRAVDEIWVRAIEDCVPALDELIRNPKHFIAESEEVLPIELTRKITGRSVAHLCRHTDYIGTDDAGELTPKKMLNVFREDSVLTYENKFLNTLINRLYSFVGKRYKVAKDRGADEKTQGMEFENSFNFADGKGTVKISVEYSERTEDVSAKRVLAGTGLWSRVERLYGVVSGYVNSAFAKEMGQNFVRPPVMRTNAIVKNKYFRECLALWEFIESYEDAGYGVTVEESVKKLSPEYAKRLYELAAVSYFTFRRSLEGGFGESEKNEYYISPSLVEADEVIPERYKELFVSDDNSEITDDTSLDDENIAISLAVALAADALVGEKTSPATKIFIDRLGNADEEVKRNFAAICNAALKYEKVKLSYNLSNASLKLGRKVFARLTVAKKSLKLYVALDKSVLPEKFRVKDASLIKRYADTPSYLKVKSNRSLKYALETVKTLAVRYNMVEKPQDEQNTSENELFFASGKPNTAFVNVRLRADLRDKAAPQTGDERISFGSAKNARNQAAATLAEKLSVKESGVSSDNPGDIKNADGKQNSANPDENSNSVGTEELLEGIKRTDSNYTKPTDFGLDDTQGFIRDAEESGETVVTKRKGLFGDRR